MDALKSASNTATSQPTTTQQSGQEPLSGEAGAGTATEPYDQGNAEGSDGAPPAESMGGLGEDVKKAASDGDAGQGL